MRTHQEIRPPWSKDPRPGLAAFIAGIALAGFIALNAAILFFPAFQSTDARVSATLREIALPGLDPLARSLTFLGSATVMTALTAIGAVWLYVRGSRSEAGLLVATMVIGTAVGSMLKLLIERGRPGLEAARIPIPDSYSFPSGHALAAFLFFGVVAFLVFILADSARVKLAGGLVCTLLALGVAFSRVYLGVHYLGDVIASWMLGSALLVGATSSYVTWVTREQRG
ncbi:MAG: phosphatase PAP2 family protein [Coriobacteriia bacterium]|nr:phosphatase PAP2 family protein [Coriobacteriia bacterium]